MKEIKFSVNKFCEYGRTISANNRNRIIKNQKEPKTGDGFPQYYSLIKYNVIEYLCSKNLIELDEAYNKINDRVPQSSWYETDNNNSKILLERVKQLNLSIFDNLVLKKYSDNQIFYNFRNVIVKVNPDIIIYDDNNTIIGGVKLHLTKDSPLNEEVRNDIALLIKLALDNQNKIVDPKLCFSIELSNSKFSICKKSFKRRLEHLEATADEISALWNRI